MSVGVLSVTVETDPVGVSVVTAVDESFSVNDDVVCCMLVNVSDVCVDEGVVSVDENGKFVSSVAERSREEKHVFV